MKKSDKIRDIISESITTKALVLYDSALVEKIENAAELITQILKKGGKVFIFGNGGSASDSQHFAAELVGRFKKERRGLPAIALTTDTSIVTSLANDYSFDIVFKRQLEALATKGDVAVAISTSGMAKNVLEAVKYAKKSKLKTISFTGMKGASLSKMTDISLVAPSMVTARIQEAHILFIHTICELVETSFK
ncbi:MAG TPA: SIS domain-containing protein [Candidatus Omnitrophota bacterium]|nr:SIS domain-containing protein [Candidatus Omnitrophota bacterium]